MTRQQQKAQTRSKLIDAAFTCFESKGFSDTQISDITSIAGVAKGTFYVHFKDKNTLLDNQLADFNQEFIQDLAAAMLRQEIDITSIRQNDMTLVLGVIAERFLNYWQKHQTFIKSYVERVDSDLLQTAIALGLASNIKSWIIQQISSWSQTESRSAEQWALVIDMLLASWFRVGYQFVTTHQNQKDLLHQSLVEYSKGVFNTFLTAKK